MQKPDATPRTSSPSASGGEAFSPPAEASAAPASTSGGTAVAPPPPARSIEVEPDEVGNALRRSIGHLRGLQHEDGHWCGLLEADSVLESEFLLLMYFLGREGDPRNQRALNRIRDLQLPGGGWAIFEGGPPEVSASTKAYFVLKLYGEDREEPRMVRARQAIRELGGVEATNTYTKIYLAAFGQYEWERCPAIPPEMMLLPDRFVFNVHDMSAWSRGIFVPLAIIWAHRPQIPVPPGTEISELFVAETRTSARNAPSPVVSLSGPKQRAWRRFFLAADRSLKWMERRRLTPLRRRSIEAAERWILARLESSDGLGAIFPAIVNTILALRCLGYSDDDPVFQGEIASLEKLLVDDGERFLQVQPAESPVWDTAQVVSTLAVAGVDPADPALLRGVEWLLDHEVRREGDWRKHTPGAEVGGWYFEYANEFYPDCDDTAEVLIALARVRPPEPGMGRATEEARRRGLSWLLSMQNPDGGWAAFDRLCDREMLTFVPFADHNAMIDPSWEDVTGRILELLALEGREGSEECRAAVRFLASRQEADGTWYGRWGCNYIYGTWLALSGLAATGVDLTEERYQRAVSWLLAHQNEDGGWGETMESYDDPTLKGIGPSTAAQTAWAVLGLMAAGEGNSLAVDRGIGYLLRMQQPDGSWVDKTWTGTGFPRVFYLRYDLYDDYFPPLALAAYLEEKR